MAAPAAEDDAWWAAVERDLQHLRFRCPDIIFQMTQNLASKDYEAVLHAFTVRRGTGALAHYM